NAAYRTLKLPRKHRQVLGVDLNCSESRRERNASAASEISPGTKKFFRKNVFHTMANPLNGQNQILPRFQGRDMKQFLNFTLPPYRGVSPRRRISLACSSRRQVTRHGRQPDGGECIRGRF